MIGLSYIPGDKMETEKMTDRDLLKMRLMQKLKDIGKLEQEGMMVDPCFTDEEYSVLDELQNPQKYPNNCTLHP